MSSNAIETKVVPSGWLMTKDLVSSPHVIPVSKPATGAPTENEPSPAPAQEVPRVNFIFMAALCEGTEWAEGSKRSFFVPSGHDVQAGAGDVVAVAGYPGG
jgi:hypothetical protein